MAIRRVATGLRIFGLLLIVMLLVLRVVAVSRRGGNYMAGRLALHVQGHSGSLQALYGEPQHHENQKKSDNKFAHIFMLAVKPENCKPKRILQADEFVLEFNHYA